MQNYYDYEDDVRLQNTNNNLIIQRMQTVLAMADVKCIFIAGKFEMVKWTYDCD